MKIILKYLFKNMNEKKGRTLLIVLAVALSTAIFFSTQSLSINLENMYLDVIKKEYGSADISITQGTTAASQVFELKEIDSSKSDYNAVVGTFIATGYLQEDSGQRNVRLYGYNSVSDLDSMNEILLEQGMDPKKKLNDDEIVINSLTAQKYGYKLDSVLKIRINGEEKQLKVVAIAYVKGLFIETGQQIPAIVSAKMLNDCYDLEDKINCIYIDVKNSQIIDDEVTRINKMYPDQTVNELLSENASKAYTERITVSFYLMSIAVFFISMFLIFSSFKVISLERMLMTGVFRSIGATKRMTNWVMLMEALVYALIGGVLGSAVGIGLLHAMLYLSSPQWIHEAGMQMKVEYSVVWLVVGLVFSLLIAFLSVLIPILGSNKYEISTLIKSKKEDGKPAKFNLVAFVVKGILFAAGMIIFSLVPNSFILFYGILLSVVILILLILIVYDVIKLLSILLRPLIFMVFRHEGTIALKNLNENASTINNVRLLTISITVYLLISVFGSSLISSISDFFSECKYQLSVTGEDIDQPYIDKVKKINGVDSVYPEYTASNIQIDGRNSTIPALSGIDSKEYLNFYEFHCDGDRQALLDRLGEGDGILVSSTLQISLSLDEGDTISLVMDNRNREFTVIGFYDTLESAALIDGKSMKEYMDLNNYNSLLVKAKDAGEESVGMLKDKVVIESADYNLQVVKLEEIKDTSLESNRQIVVIMQIFSVIVMIIAISGMTNNVIISFMEKQRIFAVQRSIGMSKFQLIKIALIEAGLTGLIGSLIGIAGGLCLLYVVPEIMMALGLRIIIRFSATELLIIMAAGIGITIVAAIGSAVKTSKMIIINAIKYE